MKAVKHLKHGKSNTPGWNDLLRSKICFLKLYRLNIITSIVESVCPKPNLLVIWNIMSANSWRLVLQKSFSINLQVLMSILCLIGLMSRVFTNGPGNWVSIPGRVIPKTQKIILDAAFLTLSIIRYGSRVKWSNPLNGVAPSPTPRCSSYWKGCLWFTLDYGCQLTLLTAGLRNNMNIQEDSVSGKDS